MNILRKLIESFRENFCIFKEKRRRNLSLFVYGDVVGVLRVLVLKPEFS